MILILHDIENFNKFGIRWADRDNTKIFSALPKVESCLECFGCFLETPGVCVINDRAQNFIEYLNEADEFHIVSSMSYGGLSIEIKAVLDRSLGYLVPYFEIRNDKMFHPVRNNIIKDLHYHIYNITDTQPSDAELRTIKNIARENAENLSAISYSCKYYKDPNELDGILK